VCHKPLSYKYLYLCYVHCATALILRRSSTKAWLCTSIMINSFVMTVLTSPEMRLVIAASQNSYNMEVVSITLRLQACTVIVLDHAISLGFSVFKLVCQQNTNVKSHHRLHKFFQVQAELAAIRHNSQLDVDVTWEPRGNSLEDCGSVHSSFFCCQNRMHLLPTKNQTDRFS
jgi:hypothetical protein